ncbi:MAG: hypothetical protein SO053_08690 [Bifidobacterium animalis]|nr:histidine kinase [Bifidobacterium animalis]MDY5041202.1 hypothetical protein [Bifidobacterium animalis]
MSELLQIQPLRARIPALVIFSLCVICCIVQFSIFHGSQVATSSSSLSIFLTVAALPLVAFSAPIAAVWVVVMTAVCLFLYPAIPLTVIGFACIAIGTGAYYSRKLGIILPMILSLGSLSNAGAFPYQEAMLGSGLCLLAICASVTMALFGRALRHILPPDHVRRANDPSQSPHTAGAQEHAIARQLHNHTTNDLANIMMLADRAQSDNEDSDKILEMIRDLSQDALHQTRESITSLEQLAHAQTNVDKLKDLINTQQERLQALGYYGEVIDSYHTRCIRDCDLKFLSDLIRELCGNLSKYADSKHPYLLMLSLESTSCTIESLNYVNSQKAGAPTMHGLGTGLKSFKNMVSNTGGEWRTQSDGKRWMLKTVIPFPQSSIAGE